MKKLLLTLTLTSFAFFSFAQTPKELKHYLGDYEVSGAPFDKIIISFENGKLMGEAVGQGKSTLKATDAKDEFEVEEFGAKVKFDRNDKKNVSALTLSINGDNIAGTRKIAPLTDYEGHYIIADGPISEMTITAEDGKVMVDIPSMGKGEISKTSPIDEFYGEDYSSDILFTRNEVGVVDSFVISVQGMTILGAKEMIAAAPANPYVGNYDFEDAPISEIEIYLKADGTLYGKSDQGEASLSKTDKEDVFEIKQYGGEAVFQKNADGSVSGLIVKVQGTEMIGSKRK